MAPAIEFGSPAALVKFLHDKTSKEINDVQDTVATLTDFPTCWMSKLLPQIGDRTLETICLPRSHDAAMYEPAKYRRMGTSSTTITQTRNIYSQLEFGVRMFDLRPCIVNGQFYCGHYEYMKPGYIPNGVREIAGKFFPDLTGWYSGGEGAPLAEVIRQVNEFTKKRTGEVIILEVTHTFNFDREVKNNEWAHLLNQAEWNRLTSELSQLNGLYVSDHGYKAQITKLKINDLVSSGHSAVIVTTSPDGVHLDPSVAGRGFFDQSVLDPLRKYHLSMEQKPIEVVCAYLKDTDHPYIAKILAGTLGKDSPYLKDQLWSIVDVARRRKVTELPKVLANSPAEGCWNVVSMDDVEDIELLNTVIKVIGKAITGKNVALILGGDGNWAFVEA